METEAFKLTRPYFAQKTGQDAAKWQAFADFALKYGLIERKVAIAALLPE